MFSRKAKVAVWSASAAAAAVLIAYAYHRYLGTYFFDYFLAFALVAVLAPAGAMQYAERQWRRAVERRLPDLLRDVAQAQRSGLTFIGALEAVASREYGPLSKELQRVVRQISWGATLEQAMTALAERVGTPLVKRVCLHIIEVARYGGDVARLIEMTASFITDFQSMADERAAAMRTYAGVVYIGALVFIVVATVMVNSFLYPIGQLQPAAAGLLTAFTIPYEVYRRIFYHMTIIQSLFGGLAAGKLAEGSVLGGLKHTVVLVLASTLVFMLFVK